MNGDYRKRLFDAMLFNNGEHLLYAFSQQVFSIKSQLY